ncbi:hypothetical protein L1887_55273 [Cichorium endivia]|nr:hypothetical protein L1887_55273 [Cichorium endivia]
MSHNRPHIATRPTCSTCDLRDGMYHRTLAFDVAWRGAANRSCEYWLSFQSASDGWLDSRKRARLQPGCIAIHILHASCHLFSIKLLFWPVGKDVSDLQRRSRLCSTRPGRPTTSSRCSCQAEEVASAVRARMKKSR